MRMTHGNIRSIFQPRFLYRTIRLIPELCFERPVFIIIPEQVCLIQKEENGKKCYPQDIDKMPVSTKQS